MAVRGGPKNWVPMMTGAGPFGPMGMSGIFTMVKIREGIRSDEDPDPYNNAVAPWPGR